MFLLMNKIQYNWPFHTGKTICSLLFQLCTDVAHYYNRFLETELDKCNQAQWLHFKQSTLICLAKWDSKFPTYERGKYFFSIKSHPARNYLDTGEILCEWRIYLHITEIQFLVFAELGYTSDLEFAHEDQLREWKASPGKDLRWSSTGIGRCGRMVAMPHLQVEAGVSEPWIHGEQWARQCSILQNSATLHNY